LKQTDFFDCAERAGLGWVSYRLPLKNGIIADVPQHFIDPQAKANRPWLEGSRDGFVVAPFSVTHGPELWLNPLIRWQGFTPNAHALHTAEDWLDQSNSVKTQLDGPAESSTDLTEDLRQADSQHYLEFCKSVRQITDLLQNQNPTTTLEKLAEQKPLQKVVWSRTRRIKLNLKAHPCQLFEALCQAYPTLHIVLLQHPTYGIWLGCSPETLVEKQSHKVRSMALAGTRTPTDSVIWGDKEIREQQIVLQYLQDRFAFRNIQIASEQTSTVRTGPVEHLLNQIEGPSTISCYEMAHLLHPTPAVSGFPIQESVLYILENEPYKRLLYSGYWGYINPQGDGLLSVNLRCLHWQKNDVTLYMGVGILPESDAEAEWMETCRKSETLLNVLDELGWISAYAEIKE